MYVAMAKPHPLLSPMCLLMLTLILKENMPNCGRFCSDIWPRCLDEFIQIYMHTFIPKYILKWICGSNYFGQIVIQKLFFFHLFCLHINRKWCSKEGSRPYQFQSQFVCAYDVLSLLLQGVLLPKNNYLLFFGPA